MMSRADNTLNTLQSILCDTASITKTSDTIFAGTRPEKSMDLKTLIYQRRHCRVNLERKKLSKAIFKLARQELRVWRTMWADHLLHKFRNTKHLQKVNIDPIQSRACPIDDADFADFLENLFERPLGEVDRAWDYSLMDIPLFGMDDFKKALAELSNLRCCDDDGVIAEMIKYSNEEMRVDILKTSTLYSILANLQRIGIIQFFGCCQKTETRRS